MDPEQRLARKRPAQAVAQQPMEGADAERSDLERPSVVDTERRLQLRRPRVVGEPSREQKTHVGFVEPPQRERQRTRRGRIEPLNVVDRDHERLASTQSLECAADGHGERAAVDGIARGLLDEERDLERTTPWWAQVRQDIVEDSVEQVT